MSSYGTPLVMALVFVALLNWYAVARGEVTTERVTKPSFHLLLIALVWLLRSDLPAAGPGRDLLVPLTAALVLYLLSDLALLATSVPRYVLGQFVAVVADITLTVAIWRGVGAAVADPGKTSTSGTVQTGAATSAAQHFGPLVVGTAGRVGLVLGVLALAALVQGRVGREIIRRSGNTRVVTFLREASLLVLALVAAWRGDVLVLVGILLFAAGHLIGAHDRFVRVRKFAPVQAMAAYHCGLALTVVALLR